MNEKTLNGLFNARKGFRYTARILAFLVLFTGILFFLFFRPSIGIYVWFFGLITLMVAWRIAWLGAVLTIPVVTLGFRWLPLGGWDYWTEFPFRVFLYAFAVSGLLFLIVSVLGWILGIEWPRKKKTPETRGGLNGTGTVR